MNAADLHFFTDSLKQALTDLDDAQSALVKVGEKTPYEDYICDAIDNIDLACSEVRDALKRLAKYK